ncbi:metallophosphoesterase [Desulfotomaculum nigrificans CO-1-SRB]|uniref:Metallophosphoesterase n=1 Tax=Desulfotomaculum nigrificans (strain DSM 14880 / VKM B-2319 / CO-1-SRB) TaxID=868595 RepID=F6B7D7_DESCC|nr:metallophosphoesterase [Desulfotomaculum nigrificans]AEF93387.1 metallophosphoesterase [Desulfotomaculum nigrificans CO-1-SRB]
MKFFAISDLHLSFTSEVVPGQWEKVELYKPMDVFNPEWHMHYRKIYENWHALVGPDDIVLLPGDISWATRLEEACHDVNFLALLPGTVYTVPGNHDYWWQGISKVRRLVPENVRPIQNDHAMVGDIAICGTRGWVCPNGYQFTEQDEKIYKRELIRLENSLRSIKGNPSEIIVMMHFMPTNESHERSGFIDILCEFGVKTVVYGHLHDRARNYRLPDEAWGIRFHLVSADFVNFSPVLIAEK